MQFRDERFSESGVTAHVVQSLAVLTLVITGNYPNL